MLSKKKFALAENFQIFVYNNIRINIFFKLLERVYNNSKKTILDSNR